MTDSDIAALFALVGLVGIFVVLFIYAPLWVALLALFGLLLCAGVNAV